ncbi:MAG: hypothetical protein ABJF10_12455 [Chthoniobacter sp.]|uniref:hypothetical protein n=1 Tax=Chthoniobacter sp. TaxID=2510640 RepID=UPI0032A15248
MKTILILSLTLAGLFGSLVARASEELPPSVIEQAKLLTLKKDYPAVLKIMPEIDQRFKGVHNADYFRSLLALVRGMGQAHERPSDDVDYGRVWSVRKVYWKIFLTRVSEPKDAPVIWKMRQSLAYGGFSCVGYLAYRNADQFVALRQDAVALLYTYAYSLRAEIIPNFHPKPDHWATGAFVPTVDPPPPTPEEIAEKKKREAEFAINGLENATQRQLEECWDQLPHSVEHLAEDDFSIPPEDDQTLSALLDQIPPRSDTKETILRNAAHARPRHAADMERWQRAQSTPAPRQP